MAISGSFGISGFGFSIVDAGCDYTASNDQYLIFGTFTLTDVFTASVQLGTGSSNPGITITNGNFVLDNFAFSLTNVPLGAFTLNYVDISYASAGDVWSGAAQVTFPTGWSIAASMTFVNGVLDDISLTYDAGTSTGIAIPDTGIFITEMSASLQNLDDPSPDHRLRLDSSGFRQESHDRRHFMLDFRRDRLLHGRFAGAGDQRATITKERSKAMEAGPAFWGAVPRPSTWIGRPAITRRASARAFMTARSSSVRASHSMTAVISDSSPRPR